MNHLTQTGHTTFHRCFRALVLLTLASTAFGDPCGMVPPIHITGQGQLQRIGLQKTYVFFRDGVETFVIRPGFKGSVEEFGMLIPFPSPPALRKVPDDTFAHIAAAVDPPEVVVDLTPRVFNKTTSDIEDGEVALPESSMSLSNNVTVIKQEAVGMYEVAVLEAGSAEALNMWMTDHGYRYPKGMDSVCEDYIAHKWCFVAVKTRVGQKSGVDARPGMTQANAALDPGASFDGHVQGMGFRFRSKALVVPMRLSAFNEGDLHNVVYLLTDEPMKARDLPARHVARQISGKELVRNLTQLLPLRIIGGRYEDIPENRRRTLRQERNPVPRNGIAKDLFAGDLLAASTGKLSHGHEEMEKELLDIGERLGLRGVEIDGMHEEAIQGDRDALFADALADLESMTLTVIDGDFDREVISEQNIYFTSYEMNPASNSAESYNARMFGPGASDDPGSKKSVVPPAIVIDDPEHGRLILQEGESSLKTSLLIGIAVTVSVVFVAVALLRKGRGAVILCLISIAGMSAVIVEADEGKDQPVQEPDQSKGKELPSGTESTGFGNPQEALGKVSKIIDEIQAGSDRAAAIRSIRELGDDSVQALIDVVRIDSNIARRGWAVICLNELNSAKSTAALDRIINAPELPHLIHTWAAAARVDDMTHVEDLQQFAGLCNQYPALRRPFLLQIERMAPEQDSVELYEHLLTFMVTDYRMQQSLAPVMLKASPGQLAQILMKSRNIDVRRQAAAWLATQKQHGNTQVNNLLTSALRFTRDAKTVPWANGPLFLPAVRWNRKEALALGDELTAWFVWCAANQQPEEIQKIKTALSSIQLMQAAGYRNLSDNLNDWLTTWERVTGADAMAKLMDRTGYKFTPARLEPTGSADN